MQNNNHTSIWAMTAISFCLAQSAATPLQAAPQDGVNYLTQSANPDGSFGHLPERDTLSTLQALRAWDGEGDVDLFVGGYYAALRPASVDLYARRISALAALELPTSDVNEALIDMANDDGTWGPYPGWQPTISDTAQAVIALSQGGSADLDAVGSALDFLVAQQSTGGGFAWEDNEDPEASLTAEVLFALLEWRDIFDVEAPLSAGTTYLFSLQGGDGLIAGHLPTLNTALALRATASLDVDAAAWSSAAGALQGEQRADGSWNQSPYVTSMALLALDLGRPDLALVRIIPQADPIIEGELVNVDVEIQNNGRGDLGEAVAVQIDYISGETGQLIALATRSLADLAAGDSATITVQWDTTDRSGGGFIQAIADSGDVLNEANYGDNTLLQSVGVLGGTDLGVNGGIATLQPVDPAPEDTLTFFETVFNYSAVALSDVIVELYDGAPDSGGSLLKTFVIDLDIGGSADIEWSGTLSQGDHDLVVLVDPDNAITEENENNNSSTLSTTIAPHIDLQVATGAVRLAPETAGEGQDVTLSITVFNGGRSPSGAFDVAAYVDTGAVRSQVDSETVANLASGDATTLTLTWTADRLGTVTLIGVADSGNDIDEPNEDNNEASDTVFVLEAPNLALLDGDIIAQATAVEGDIVPLSATVRNTGGGQINNVPVSFYVNSTAGTRIGTAIVQELPADSTAITPTINWYTSGQTPGDLTIIAVVDPDDGLLEANENDNQDSQAFTLGPRPDLIVSGGLTASPSAPEQGNIVTLTASIENQNSTAVTDSFDVSFYDGSPGSGTLIGATTIAGLAANASTTTQVSWDTEGEAGRHTLYAVMDTEGVVDEADETNNRATLALTVTSGDADLEPPTNLSSSVVGDNVTLSWSASGNPAGYRVYRSGLIVNPPDTTFDLVPAGTVSASTSIAAHGADFGADGDANTYWEGDDDVDEWTYEVDFGEEQEVLNFQMQLRSQGSLSLGFALQTFDGTYWYTQLSSGLSSSGSGGVNASFTLPKTSTTQRARLLLSRSDPNDDPASIYELVINPPALLTGTSFVDINVPAKAHEYEVRAANGGGREGEPALLDVPVGDVEPPVDPVAFAYADRTEIYWSPSPSSSNLGYELVRDNAPLINAGPSAISYATASSTESGYPVSAAVDGDPSTLWISSVGHSHTFDIVLPQDTRIYYLGLTMDGNYYATKYDIMGWTGSQWIIEESVEDNIFTSRGHLFSQFGATNKIRVKVHNVNSDRMSMAEVLVYLAYPVDATGVTDGYRPDYALTYAVGAMSEDHVAFADTEPFVPPAGEEPPEAPSTLEVASYTRSDITLSWPAVSSDTLAGYYLYDTETGERIHEGTLVDTTFTVEGVIDPNDLAYGYAVAAVNIYGYESPFARAVDWVPPEPEAPTLTADIDGTTIALDWSEAANPFRDGFRLFKDSGLYLETPAATFTDIDVSAGDHSYYVLAYDLFGREGDNSNVESFDVVRADFVIESADISLAPEPAGVADSGVLSATIFNQGDQGTGSATVTFYDGNPDAGGSVIDQTPLSALAAFGLKTVSVDWDLASEEGNHSIYVVVDSGDAVDETDEANNTASTSITIYGPPAFDVAPGTVDVSAFSILSMPVVVNDVFGQPAPGLAPRFVSVTEGGLDSEVLDFVEGDPGQYTLTYQSATRSRDGSSRTGTVTLDVDSVVGAGGFSYTAPSNALSDFAAVEVTALPQAPEEDDDISLTVTVANLGSETETNVPVRIYLGDSGGAVVGEGTIASIAAGDSASASISAIALAGTNTYVAVVDPDDNTSETNEDNNETSLPLFAPANPFPDMIVYSANLSLSPTSPEGGDGVTLSALIENVGAEASNVQVQAYLGDPSEGGRSLGGAQTISLLGKREQITLTFPWDTTGLEGNQVLLVWVDPLNRIEERDEDNNRAFLDVDVTPPNVTLALSLNDDTLGANTDLTITANVAPNGDAFAGTVVAEILTEDGALIETLDPVDLSLSLQSRNVDFTWNTARTLAGAYQVEVVLFENPGDPGAERRRATSTFTILAEKALAATLTTDAATYDPFAAALLAGGLLNTSPNSAIDAVTSTLEVESASGQTVFTQTFDAQALALDQGLSVEASWTLGDAAPGQYTARILATASGASAEQETTFEVLSTADTGVGLLGSLTLSVPQAIPGEAVTADYTLENRGNAGVSNLPVRVRSVAVDGGDVCEDQTFTVTLGKDDSTGATLPLDTSCPEGSYSVTLEIEIAGEWRTLSGANLGLLSILGESDATPGTIEGGTGSISLSWGATNQADISLDNLNFTARLVNADTLETLQSWPWQVSLDAGEKQTTSESVDSTDLGIGAFTLTLELVPEEGSATILATSAFTVVDTLKPSTLLTFDGQTAVEDDITYMPLETRIVLSAGDNFSGVAEVKYAIDSGDSLRYSGAFTPPTEGLQNLSYFAKDIAGNVEDTQDTDIVVDGSDPTLVVDGPGDDSCQAESFSYALEITDDSPTTLTMTLNGAPYLGGEISAIGRYVFEAVATDILDHQTVVGRTVTVVGDDCECTGEGGCDTPQADADGDGFTPADGDCDDIDPDRFPGADEACNGLDDDCDDAIDESEDCATPTAVPDQDGDGWGDGTDCEPTNPDINPSATETCDGVDQDCDSQIDEGACDTPTPDTTPTNGETQTPSATESATSGDTQTPSETTPPDESATPSDTEDQSPTVTTEDPTASVTEIPTPTVSGTPGATPTPLPTITPPDPSATVPETTPIGVPSDGSCDCNAGDSGLPPAGSLLLILGLVLRVRRRETDG